MAESQEDAKLTPRTDALASVHDEAAEWVERTAGYSDLLNHARQLERELASLSPAVPEGWVAVPKSAMDWLMGEGDDFEPSEEQKARSYGPGNYWWRSEFRRRISAIPVPAEQAQEAKVCTTAFPISECPNMKAVPGDKSMDYEHYECKVCGKRSKLDYEEMR